MEPTERVSPGELFMAFHFPEALANALTSDATDEHTDCPEYKLTAVRVRPASASRLGLVMGGHAAGAGVERD